MYESSCSYAGALELKRTALKEEPWPATEWPPYRLHQSTFEQLKQSVEKAKAALQDRSGLLSSATAFGDFYGGQLGQDAAGTTLGFGRTRNEDMLGSMDKGKTVGELLYFYVSTAEYLVTVFPCEVKWAKLARARIKLMYSIKTCAPSKHRC